MASTDADDGDADRSRRSGDGVDAATTAADGDAQELVSLELRGVGSASATASLVRGFAALLGDTLKTTFSHAQGDDAAAADDDAVSAIVTSSWRRSSSSSESNSESDAAAPTSAAGRMTEELRGRDAIVRWMRARLEKQVLAPPARLTAAPKSPLPEPEPPLRIFVSGDRSQVGKSTVCLGLVGALLRHGFAPEDVAYIKPATQCEQPQLVAKFCRARGVACTPIGPIVFYAGFTREFLARRTEPADVLLAQAREAVAALGRGKKVVVVDGVGYPAVGSICGVSNAAVARAVQAPVVLVGKRGVGDAVDSFNLNATFFERERVKVLGAIFNRLPCDGYYSLANCRESVTAYFDQYQPHKHVYGFIPEMEQNEEEGEALNVMPCDGENSSDDAERMTPAEARQAKIVIDTFYEHVNLTQLLEDAKRNQSLDAMRESDVRPAPRSAATEAPKRAISETSGSVPQKRSRAEIQAAARASGAAGG